MVQIENRERNTVFASSNRADGFHSDFEAVFSEVGRRILLKGGPGTGKSSFLRAAAEAAEKRGMAVERFACSSDPSSLDGVMIPALDLALADATAPHEMSPRLPGAADSLVDLGQFWDRKLLAAHRVEIETLGAKKAAGYRLALLGLRGEGEALSEGLRRLEKEALLREKTEAAAGRLIERARGARHSQAVGRQKLRHIETVGMQGRVRLAGLAERAAGQMTVTPLYGSEALFLEALRRQALDAGLAVTVSMAPLQPELPNALLLEESGLLFLAGEPLEVAPIVGRVNMRRFLRQETLASLRPLLRELRAAGEGYSVLTREGFSQMKEAHFALEALYGAAMDFSAKERFQADFIASLFA